MIRALRALVPYRRIRYRTALTPEQVRDALRARIALRPAGPRWMSGFGDVGDWRGDADERGFRLRRVIGYRNSFLPTMCGTVAPTPSGAQLDVRMRMHPMVEAFTGVWMLFATLGGLVGLTVAIANGAPQALLGLVVPLGGCLIVGLGFRFEARRAEELLRAQVPPQQEARSAGPFRSTARD